MYRSLLHYFSLIYVAYTVINLIIGGIFIGKHLHIMAKEGSIAEAVLLPGVH